VSLPKIFKKTLGPRALHLSTFITCPSGEKGVEAGGGRKGRRGKEDRRDNTRKGQEEGEEQAEIQEGRKEEGGRGEEQPEITRGGWKSKQRYKREGGHGDKKKKRTCFQTLVGGLEVSDARQIFANFFGGGLNFRQGSVGEGGLLDDDCGSLLG
jgi:hypothetical protein